MKRALFLSQAILQFFIGLGAVGGGALMIIAPDGRLLTMSVDMLKDSPFRNFLLPGLILFIVNGVGHLISGVLSVRRHALAGWAGIIFGLGLMIWIFVQVNMIGGGHWLQYTYFGLGLAELLLGIGIREQA